MKTILLIAALQTTAPPTISETGPRTILTRPLNGDWQHIGERVRVEGDVAIVSSDLNDDVVVNNGAVLVYRRGVDGWSEEAVLTPSDPVPSEWMTDGAIDLCGDTIVAASQHYGIIVPSPNRGRVHVFRQVGGQWEVDAILEQPDFDPAAPHEQWFGRDVVLVSEDELLVGASTDNLSEPSDGMIYVFERDASGAWNHEYTIRPEGSHSGVLQNLGNLMETDGHRVVDVGGTPGPNAMRIAILERDLSGRWGIVDAIPWDTNFTAPNVGGVAVSDDWIFVGNESYSCFPILQPGRVDVFRRSNGAWVPFQVLRAQEPFTAMPPWASCSFGDSFGSSLAFGGGRLAVGAVNAIVDDYGDGAAEVFEFNGTEFVRTHVLRNRVINRRERFGDGIDLDGDSVVVGATYYIDPNATPSNAISQPGGVAFFDLPRGSMECPGEVNSIGMSATLQFYGSESLAIGDAYAKARGLPPGQTCLPLVGSSSANVPGAGGSTGTLCLGGQLGRFYGGVAFADANGEFEFDVDPAALPISSGFVSISPGETWRFQVWYRDVTPTDAQTSNFTGAVAATFDD